jgi:hypothetical protein
MCDINNCTNAATARVGGTIKLCDTHANEDNFPRTRCGSCNKTVKIANTVFVRHTPFGAPSNIVLCETCVALPRVACGHCTKVVSVGGDTVATHTPFGAPSNIALCQTCAALPRVTCTKCQRILRVDTQNVAASSNYADGAVILCGACNPTIAHRCRACSIPAACTNAEGAVESLPNASFIHQADDQSVIVGWRCSICTVGPLRTTAEAQTAYNAAAAWMTTWLQTCQVAYPAYGARLEWSIDRDATFTMAGGGQELGHCVTTTYGGGRLPTHRIRVLFYMRPISFQQTLVHELTHALTNERGIGNKPLIEGFCNYVTYLFLTSVSNTGTLADRAEARRAIARMEANDDVTYGVNFRTVRNTLANRPTEALTWLAST